MSPLTIGSSQVGAGTVGSRGTVGGGIIDAAATAMSSESALTGSGTKLALGGGAMDAASALTGSGTKLALGSAAMTSTADLAGSGTSYLNGAAALSGQSDLTGSGTSAHYVSAAPVALSASSDLAGSGASLLLGAADLSAVSSLAGAGSLLANGVPTVLTGDSGLLIAPDGIEVIKAKIVRELGPPLWPCPKILCGGVYQPRGMIHMLEEQGDPRRQTPGRKAFICDTCDFEYETDIHGPFEPIQPPGLMLP